MRVLLALLTVTAIPLAAWLPPSQKPEGRVDIVATPNGGIQPQAIVDAAGEIAHLSYDAQIITSAKGMPRTLRLSAYRSDPDSGLLGPLKATHFGFGDVEGFDSGLTGSMASGRGSWSMLARVVKWRCGA